MARGWPVGTASAPSDDALGNVTDTGTFETEDGKCYTVSQLNGHCTDTTTAKLSSDVLNVPYPTLTVALTLTLTLALTLTLTP